MSKNNLLKRFNIQGIFLSYIDIQEEYNINYKKDKKIFKLNEIHFIKSSKEKIENRCKKSIEKYDLLDSNSDGYIKGWVEFIEGKYILYIASPDVINFPKNCTGLFSVYNTDFNLINLEKIVLNNICTKNVIDMSHMFDRLKNLKTIDLSNLDTSNVTDMSYMFYGLESITKLDLSNFDTSKVIDMSDMFASSFNIREINLSSFNTKKVTSMSEMFFECEKLENISLKSFDCSNVSEFDLMFAYNNSIKKIDLSNFKISNPFITYRIFKNCIKLKEIDISGNDFSKLMYKNKNVYSGMFEGISSTAKIYVKDEKEKIYY